MSEEASFASPSGELGPLVDVGDPGQVDAWARKLDVSPQQIREAVAAVGTSAANIEEYLKGTRATTNADRTSSAGTN